MQELGLQVANVAGRDLLVGPEEFARLRDELAIDFVSANVRVGGEPLVERFRVYERQLDGRTVRFGVTGVTVQSRAALEAWNEVAALEFTDPVAAARDVLAQLRDASDVQILLAELPPRALDELVAQDRDGYDLLISSLGRLLESTPVGGTPVVLSPGSRGKHLAWVNLQSAAGGVAIVGGEVLRLDEKIQDDPVVATRVLEFKERLRAARPTSAEERVSAQDAVQKPQEAAKGAAETP